MILQHPPIIYLACPYTDASAEVKATRFKAATEAAAFLINRKHVVLSPITMTHPIDIILAGREATLGSAFWVDFDEAFMEFCSVLAVLMLDGWRESSGVSREIEFFKRRNRPIEFLDPALPNYGLSQDDSAAVVPAKAADHP